jgi:glycosyltransferase involved in cell wall biosynthesis
MHAAEPDRLRVAVDATPLLGVRTGIGVFVRGALAALAARPDLDLLGYALSARGYPRLAGALPPGIRPSHVPMAAAPLLRLWARFDMPVAEWWTGRVDVVHGTNFVVPPARRAARAVTVHDLTAVRFPELCTPTARMYPHLVRRALAGGAVVHTHTAVVATQVMEVYGVGPDRVHAVAPGLDLPVGPSAAGPSPAGPPYVLALGTVEPRKDLPTLVRAFDAVAAGHPGVRLVVAGPSGWGEAALAAAVASARYRAAVDRVGWVADGERAALLAGASALAFPSRDEGFGLPPLEAMAAGVPVVATSAGAIPEVVGDAALLVPVGDEAALAAALARVLDDSGERSRLIAAGHRRAACFTWERCAAGLARLYRDAAGARV